MRIQIPSFAASAHYTPKISTSPISPWRNSDSEQIQSKKIREAVGPRTGGLEDGNYLFWAIEHRVMADPVIRAVIGKLSDRPQDSSSDWPPKPLYENSLGPFYHSIKKEDLRQSDTSEKIVEGLVAICKRVNG